MSNSGCSRGTSEDIFNFSAVAESYDDWYRRSKGRVYDRLEKRALARLTDDLPAGLSLLEVGCGTGHWSRVFSERGFRVVGVDISPKMVRVARGKGIGEADFAVADGGELPFKDGSFDIAVAITVLEFIPEPQMLLREMARCVRRGGRLVLGVLNRFSLNALIHRIKPSSIVSKVRFFSPRELVSILAQFGRHRIFTTAFVIPIRPALWTAPATNFLGELLNLPFGDFIWAEVRL